MQDNCSSFVVVNLDFFPELTETTEANFSLITETMGIIIWVSLNTNADVSIGNEFNHSLMIFPLDVLSYMKSCWSGFTLGGGIAVHLVVSDGSMIVPGFLLLIGE